MLQKSIRATYMMNMWSAENVLSTVLTAFQVFILPYLWELSTLWLSCLWMIVKNSVRGVSPISSMRARL